MEIFAIDCDCLGWKFHASFLLYFISLNYSFVFSTDYDNNVLESCLETELYKTECSSVIWTLFKLLNVISNGNLSEQRIFFNFLQFKDQRKSFKKRRRFLLTL